MEAEHLLGSGGRGCEPGDGDRRRVGDQDRLPSHYRVEVGEDLGLQRLVLGGGLDHQIGVAQALHGLGIGDAAEGLVLVLLADLAGSDLAGEVLVDSGQGLLDPLLGDVVERHIVAGQSDDMSDAAAHLACPDDADLADGSHIRIAFRGRVGPEA